MSQNRPPEEEKEPNFLDFNLGRNTRPVRLIANCDPYPMTGPAEMEVENFLRIQEAEKLVTELLGPGEVVLSLIPPDRLRELASVCRTALPIMFPTLEKEDIPRVGLLAMVMATRFFSGMSDHIFKTFSDQMAPTRLTAVIAERNEQRQSTGTPSSPISAIPTPARPPKAGSKRASARSSQPVIASR